MASCLYQKSLGIFAVLVALHSASVASHVPRAAASTNKFCSTVDAIVTRASQQSAASAYCQQYLSITTSTITVSSTTTSTSITGTTTTTATAALSPNCVLPNDGLVKRKLKREPEKRNPPSKPKPSPKPKPSCLSHYTASNLISSACSCLSIPTPLTTTSVPGSMAVSLAEATVTATVTPMNLAFYAGPLNTQGPFYAEANGAPEVGLDPYDDQSDATTFLLHDDGTLSVADTSFHNAGKYAAGSFLSNTEVVVLHADTQNALICALNEVGTAPNTACTLSCARGDYSAMYVSELVNDEGEVQPNTWLVSNDGALDHDPDDPSGLVYGGATIYAVPPSA